MIEPMQKAHILCLREDREQTLEALRGMAVIHLTAASREESEELVAAARRNEQFDRLLFQLGDRKEAVKAPESAEIKALDGPGLMEAGFAAANQAQTARDQLEQLNRQIEQLRPWGDFDRQTLQDLRAKGLDLRLCVAPGPLWDELELPAGVVRQVVNEGRDGQYCLLLSREPITVSVPEVSLPAESLAELEDHKRRNEEQLAAAEARLDALAAALPRLRQQRLVCADEAEFYGARDSAADFERLVAVTGFVPRSRADDLTAAAKERGWALRLDDPEEGDSSVPTKLTVPKWLQVALPIFDFVGIRPGYEEFDISAWFLIFFAIFFAMIFGDGGYGLLVIGAALVLKAKLDQEKQTVANLVLILGVCTLIWGALSGTWFGIEPRSKLPAFMRGVPWFHEDINVEYLCFLIGAIHLSIAHLWRGLVVINSLRCLSQFGWILILWGNFFLGSMLVTQREFPGWAKWLYIVGGACVLLFSAPSPNPLKAIGKGVGEILGNAVNSFVDVLSYIRLFAVGLSSFYVADAFNDMGMMLTGNPVGLVLGIVVIIFGHVLNITLCGLGVLVHGIRLNTLEFSGHIGITWAGIPFRAFARQASEPTDKAS